MTKLCQNCARQFLCENYKKIDDCNKFISFIYTKNYGKINKLKLDNLEVFNDKRGFEKLH